MILLSTTASLWFNTQRIGKCRDVRVNLVRATLRTTKQGDLDETYIKGIRSASGSATLFYDPEDNASTTLLNDIRDDNLTRVVDLRVRFDEKTVKEIDIPIIITQISASVATGEAHFCQVDFQATGRVQGAF